MSIADRRRTILTAASRLFAHYGHGKTTMADVAREAQVGVGTVYLEFDSKEALVEALSSSTHADVVASMRQAASTARDPAERLRAALTARTEAFLVLREQGQHACELLHCKAEAVIVAHRRFKKDELDLLCRILADGSQAEVFATDDPALTASLVQRAFASLSPPWIFELADDARTTTRNLVELLLAGLLGPHGRAKRPATTDKRRPRRS